MGEFAPVEAQVREQDGPERRRDNEDHVRRIRKIPVGRPDAQDAQRDEGERDCVGTNHPLAMLGDVAIARCKEGGEGTDDPGTDLHDGASKERAPGADYYGQNRGGNNAEDVEATKNAVKGNVSPAQARGKLEWATEQSEGAEESVREEQVAVGDQLNTVLVVQRVVGNEEDFVGDEDEKSDKTEQEPERMFGHPAKGRRRGA